MAGPIWRLARLVAFAFTVAAVVALLRNGDAWLWLFLAASATSVASFLPFHRERVARMAELGSLPTRIDGLQHEGIELLDELFAEVEPERAGDGSWSIKFGAPPERWEKAEVFDRRARDLLSEAPALLSDYAAGANAHIREAREREIEGRPNPETDNRPDGVKLREFANHTHFAPARRLAASLEGLSAARHRIGYQGGVHSTAHPERR